MRLIVLAISLCFSTALAALSPQPFPTPNAGDYLIIYQQGLDRATLSAEAIRLGAKGSSLPELREALRQSAGAFLTRDLAMIDVEQVQVHDNSGLVLLRQSPLVKVVEPHARARKASPNDTLYGAGLLPWYDNIGATQAFNAWVAGQITLTSQVKVAVIDTGVDAHAELIASGQLLSGQGFVVSEPGTDDMEGHGTWVAGIIAAATSNSAGTAGVFFASNLIRIVPVKVLDATGSGGISDIAAGILWAADQNIPVINLSLESSVGSDALERAVGYARNKGSLVVAAAGNEDSGTGFPAAYGNVMAVGSLSFTGYRADYSNYGRLDIAAPGGDSVGTCACVGDGVATGCVAEIWGLCHDAPYNQYQAAAGTSFSSPMVAAAAALLKSQDASRGPEDLYRLLVVNTDVTVYGSGWHPEVGWGRLNIYKALTYAGGPAAKSSGALKVYNWPNPFHPDKQGTTNIHFELPSAQKTHLSVRDMAGDLVWEKELSASQTQAGVNLQRWDGRDGRGRGVAHGVYLIRVETSSQTGRCQALVLQ